MMMARVFFRRTTPLVSVGMFSVGVIVMVLVFSMEAPDIGSGINVFDHENKCQQTGGGKRNKGRRLHALLYLSGMAAAAV